MKPITLLVLLALLPAIASPAAVYKYVDKDGRVHYTDSPPEDVAKIEVKIERPDAPVRKIVDWQLREQEMKQRMVYAKNQERDCEAASGRYREMRTALKQNRRALIYFGGERITPGYLDFLEKDLKRQCDEKPSFDIRY